MLQAHPCPRTFTAAILAPPRTHFPRIFTCLTPSPPNHPARKSNLSGPAPTQLLRHVWAFKPPKLVRLDLENSVSSTGVCPELAFVVWVVWFPWLAWLGESAPSRTLTLLNRLPFVTGFLEGPEGNSHPGLRPTCQMLLSERMERRL